MRDSTLFKTTEDSTSHQPQPKDSWKVLIVDDDEAVHSITRLVLRHLEIDNKKVSLISAYTAREARRIIAANEDIAMAFVDVVMETDDAGLELIRWIRQDLKNQSIRLILRTGQPGAAPEQQVVRDFDINDYKDKTEFSADRMVTTVYSAIRSYRDIITIEQSVNGFHDLLKASNAMLKYRDLQPFANAAMEHLVNLLNMENSALYIVNIDEDIYLDKKYIILACRGRYVCQSSSLIRADLPLDIKEQIDRVFATKLPYISRNCFVGYYEPVPHKSTVLYVQFDKRIEPLQARLLELYSTNLVLILETIVAQEEIERTQKDLMYIVGDAIEARSRETGAHVKRVAKICELMAKKLHLPDDFVKAIKLAAPLHDIGKVAIPESILHKPGKLTPEEWETMKTHAEIGGELLGRSDTVVAKAGARLARGHHENWDGSGYPGGYSGESIPLEARIMAVADVFDALGSKRSYKEPWPDKEIINYMTEQSGKKFQPCLVDLLLENYEEFAAIRKEFPDHES